RSEDYLSRELNALAAKPQVDPPAGFRSKFYSTLKKFGRKADCALNESACKSLESQTSTSPPVNGNDKHARLIEEARKSAEEIINGTNIYSVYIMCLSLTVVDRQKHTDPSQRQLIMPKSAREFLREMHLEPAWEDEKGLDIVKDWGLPLKINRVATYRMFTPHC
ncbi:hypothetical protein IWQ60_011554, partial [Tieghemiomyces parasiticus]